MSARYDIFSGTEGKNPLWLEAVAGFKDAVSRMEQRARKYPGQYFVFDAIHHTIVASIQTNQDSGSGSDGGTFVGR